MTADEGVIRIGLAHYNDDQDIDRLIAALKEII
jgi:selenocysteine lyase/cysteine desulfurase